MEECAAAGARIQTEKSVIRSEAAAAAAEGAEPDTHDQELVENLNRIFQWCTGWYVYI